jgi:hypothetical protein
MTITLEIKPEVQAELARQASVQGRPVEVVAAALLEGEGGGQRQPRQESARTARGGITVPA